MKSSAVSVAGGVMRSPVGGCVVAAAASSASCFSCSQRSQSSGATKSGRAGSVSNQSSTARAQRRLGAQAPREAQLGEAEAEAVEQLAQRPQALQLLGAVEAVAAGRAAQREQSGALDVAKHPRRPAGRRAASLIVSASIGARNLTTTMSMLPAVARIAPIGAGMRRSRR